MSQSDDTGYGESPDTTNGPSRSDLVDGVPGEDRSDGGERDEVTLTTDDDAQRDDGTVRPGNVPD
ncbi:hypothetical protein SAMN05660209_02898 [Geodermatophilus africanus]|jgi:hypothetical protein|uniref:Uncharacterized protein n=1 Tax=Geodermatophilus africanus TaxID=1137993 RepID=A0A1H3K1W5_9ACTN|nr:hypothetical protein [Geodermatophilus africanus]SDY45598.1 hypothetical protein SAMN05660209_02898 [Geodermatophilus africanus]